MTTHDFEAALKDLNWEIAGKPDWLSNMEAFCDHFETIRFALSFTMRAMGEPSADASLEGAHALRDTIMDVNQIPRAASVYKAMTAALAEEIEKEMGNAQQNKN